MEESITSSLVESFTTLLPAEGSFVGIGAFFLAMTWLEENLPAKRVEGWLCGGGIEVGGGTKLEARETMGLTGAGGWGGAVGGANDDGGIGGARAKGWEKNLRMRRMRKFLMTQ